MPAKDRSHDGVIRALHKDSWTVTDEQFTIILLERYLFVDLRAEKQAERLAILLEIKEFREGESLVEQLANAVGKYLLYRAAMKLTQNNDPLYLAVPVRAYNGILNESLGIEVVRQNAIRLVVFDSVKEEIVQWIPKP